MKRFLPLILLCVFAPAVMAQVPPPVVPTNSTVLYGFTVIPEGAAVPAFVPVTLPVEIKVYEVSTTVADVGLPTAVASLKFKEIVTRRYHLVPEGSPTTQPSPVGVDPALIPQQIRVRWPDGTVQVIEVKKPIPTTLPVR